MLMLLSVASLAQSQSPTIVHEYFDPATASMGAAGSPDTQVEFEQMPVPAPPTEAEAGSHERVADDAPPPSRPNGQSGARSSARLDEDTRPEGMLDYFEVFNPSVAPHKREGALDSVRIAADGEYELVVADPKLSPLELVGDVRSPERDRFWASMLFDAAPGSVFAIPSVAAEARILVAQSNPEQKLQFFKDGADNHYVRFEQGGELRLNFVTDASASYFAMPSLPEGLSLRALRELYPIPELPSQAKRAAKQVIKEIGIDARRDEFTPTLQQLTAYFRAFTAEPLDHLAATGDRYLDVSLQRRGVCRHRSMAFMVTAQALGINARYVFNEAHAFVEVMVPRQGWLRIDLGGAAEGLEVHASEQTLRHEAREANALDAAWPDGLGGMGSAAERAGFERVEGLPASSRVEGSAVPSSDAEAMEAAAPFDEAKPPIGAAAQAEEADGTMSVDPNAVDEPPPRPGLQPSLLRITSHPSSARRGEAIDLAGMLTARDRREPIADATIYIMASSVERPHAPALILATTTSSKIGTFVVSAELAPTMQLGAWDVFAYFSGNDHFSASRSR
jgi:hypothetical protein